MIKVEPTNTISIDDVIFEVSKMSPHIQQLVAYYDSWRQEEVELTSKLTMVTLAIQALKHDLVNTINAERSAARERAEALGVATPLAPAAEENSAP